MCFDELGAAIHPFIHAFTHSSVWFASFNVLLEEHSSNKWKEAWVIDFAGIIRHLDGRVDECGKGQWREGMHVEAS